MKLVKLTAVDGTDIYLNVETVIYVANGGSDKKSKICFSKAAHDQGEVYESLLWVMGSPDDVVKLLRN